VTYASTARPDESVVSLSEMLGTRGVAASSRVGRAPTARTGLAAGALLLREGYQGTSIGVCDGPRHYRPDAIVRAREPEEVAAAAEPADSGVLSGARLRLATATGAVVALGSLVGASTMNGGSSPAPVSATVRELGNVYAGYGVLSGPDEPGVISRPQAQSSTSSLSPLRGSASADRSNPLDTSDGWTRSQSASDVRSGGHSRHSTGPAAPDRSRTLAAADAGQQQSQTKKRWPFSRNAPDKKGDTAALVPGANAGRSATPDRKAGPNGKAAAIGKAGSDKASSRLGRTSKSGTGTTDRPAKSSKSDRSSSKGHSSSDSNGGSKHSSSGSRGSSGKSGSHGGGHSSGKSGGHKH
jgi:hypothetical protein